MLLWITLYGLLSALGFVNSYMDYIRRYEDGLYEDGFYEDGFYEDILKCA